MKGTVTMKLDEETRRNLRIIAEEKYGGEINASEALKKLAAEEVTELMETQEAIEAKQEALREGFGNSDDGDTSNKETDSDDSVAAQKQAEIRENMLGGNQ
ncbi:hypothetical protein A4G99_07050 [Haladaptatus sp. R4]|uniref:hypothetical protein n=1 Tax=Haladaptatus sp. R4 TaxID=1679489 RepID=UPI0007B4AE4F|nr:hypothetical protein [Haladaptatus sp. R4]KZN24193.1 hypothetical protein A4G99_07050 [Haladaptatus sp. R4]